MGRLHGGIPIPGRESHDAASNYGAIHVHLAWPPHSLPVWSFPSEALNYYSLVPTYLPTTLTLSPLYPSAVTTRFAPACFRYICLPYLLLALLSLSSSSLCLSLQPALPIDRRSPSNRTAEYTYDIPSISLILPRYSIGLAIGPSILHSECHPLTMKRVPRVVASWTA